MNIKESLQNCVRILKIAKKADADEFWDTVRICGIGFSLVGLTGFLFYIVSILFGGL